jgi:hypothetical protein
MQRIIYLFLLALLPVTCNQAPGEKEKAETERIGKIVAVTVEELVANPSEFENKEVAVSGMVTHVCRHGGQKCFVLGEDGETQIRIVPGGDIDEFKIDLEGSTVAFRGIFRMMNPAESAELIADHESKAHHDTVMAHTEAEKADLFIEAVEVREVAR